VSNTISTLLTVIFTTCSVKTTPRVGARPSTKSSPKIASSASPVASTVAVTRSSVSQARSRLLTLTFGISHFPGPKKRQWRADPVGIGPPGRGASLRRN